MWEWILAVCYLVRELVLGPVICLYWHMWPHRRLWVVTIGTHSGRKVIVCRKCGRMWSFRPLKGWE